MDEVCLKVLAMIRHGHEANGHEAEAKARLVKSHKTQVKALAVKSQLREAEAVFF